MTRNSCKHRLMNGEHVIAVNLGGRNLDVMSSLAKFGAHAAFIDCERSGIGLDVATNLILEARVAGITSLVRSWTKEPAVLVQYLDRRADGLVVPHVNTAREVAEIVEVVRYACGEVVAQEKIVIVQIETMEAIRNLEEMLLVPGVDAFLIGPNDLAYDITGQRGVLTSEVETAISEVSSRLRRESRPFGMPGRFENLNAFNSCGARFLYYPMEWLLERALKELSGALDSSGSV
ncbi:hypothetical protein Q9L58_010754 [Maublancomyces gigas]|uniref:HpcH/HpaI aldolase/citrate lyase domain-containing protein n=1 Tax=Discina gigas TaxID=1032678 RepID=A0ABR3G389_9PEZI